MKTLSFSIKDVEEQYKKLFKSCVDNINGLAQVFISIPNIKNPESEKEINNIKCKFEFSSPNTTNCVLDCEFNIEIIPFNIIIYCKEYNLSIKSDDNYILCLSKIRAGDSINLFFKNYNIDEELKFSYCLEPLENNTSNKPDIKKEKDKLI